MSNIQDSASLKVKNLLKKRGDPDEIIKSMSLEEIPLVVKELVQRINIFVLESTLKSEKIRLMLGSDEVDI